MNTHDSEHPIEKWDLDIQPTGSIFNINLSEVWKYKYLLFLFVKRDFIAQYKQTILGPFWHLFQPILTSLIYVFVFGSIAKIPTDGLPPILFYLSGITLWNYFVACFTNTSNTFVANAGIFGKVYFPRLVIPLSVVASNMIRFGIQMLLLCGVMVYFHLTSFPLSLSPYMLLLPVLIILMAGIGLGMGILVSSLTTKYRDFTILVTFGVQLMMYATPIVYPLSFIQNTKYIKYVEMNPLTAIVEGFRYALFQNSTFQITDLIYPLIFMVVILAIGLLTFSRVERSFMDTV